MNFDLLGHPVMTHFCSLSIYGWIWLMLSKIIARLFAYAVVVHVEVNMLKWFSMSYFSNHHSNGYRNMINKYELRVSLCMVPRLIVIGCVVPKWLPVKDVVEFLYMFPTISTTSKGKPKSSIRASSMTWSMEPKAFW